MAAYTINDTNNNKAFRLLETLTATNGAVSAVKAVKVPGWAKYLSAHVFITSQGGTTPQLDFALIIPSFDTVAKFAAPTDDNPITLASITQVTGTGPYHQVIFLGPGVTGIADDATGAATADAFMATNCVLPPWLAYDLHTTAGDADEDVAVNLVFNFRS